MALVIMSLLTVVLGGLMLAVQTAQAETQSLEETSQQAQVTLERIKYMVLQAGLYQRSGTESVLGLAVVPRAAFDVEHPCVLVVWSGGRNGGMAAAGVQRRLPRVDELVIYTPDPVNVHRLVELVVPGDASPIDLSDPTDSGFRSRIWALIESETAEKVLLCDRLRRAEIAGFGTLPLAQWGAAWFELTEGRDTALPGVAQALVRMELQLNRRMPQPAGNSPESQAIPFFGCASRRYAYRS